MSQCPDYPKPDKNRMSKIIFVNKMFFFTFSYCKLENINFVGSGEN